MTNLDVSDEVEDSCRDPGDQSSCTDRLVTGDDSVTQNSSTAPLQIVPADQKKGEQVRNHSVTSQYSIRNDFRAIPQEMRERPQWVLFKRKERRGGHSKIPLMPNGKPAKVDDPSTWSKYEDVLTALQTDRFDGVGYVFTEADPYVGIDLDKCLNPTTRQVEPGAQSIVDAMKSYTERSISGTGLHIIVKASMPGSASNRDGHGLEVYSQLRYFVMTGDRLADQPASINHRKDELERILRDRGLLPTALQDATALQDLEPTVRFDFNATLPAKAAQILREDRRLYQLWDMAQPLRSQRDESPSGFGYLLLGQLARRGVGRQDLLDTLVAFRNRHKARKKSKAWYLDEVEKARRWSRSQSSTSSTSNRRHPPEVAFEHWCAHREDGQTLDAVRPVYSPGSRCSVLRR